MPDTKFHIRDAEEARGDAQFISDAFDSAIPVLVAAGSGGQWGPDLLSSDPEFAPKVAKMVRDAENHRKAGEGSAVEALVAEVDLPEGERFEHVGADGRMKVAVGVLRDEWWPEYMREPEHLAPVVKEEKNWAYLHLLISDYRARGWRRGAGAALVEEVKARARARGRDRLWVDCWAGNDRKLVR